MTVTISRFRLRLVRWGGGGPSSAFRASTAADRGHTFLHVVEGVFTNVVSPFHVGSEGSVHGGVHFPAPALQVDLQIFWNERDESVSRSDGDTEQFGSQEC